MRNKNKLYSYSIVSLLTLTTVLGLLYSNNVSATTTPRRIKFKFTPEEDNRLSELVEKNKANSWQIIAKQMPRRNARQCRERWVNYLNPTVNQKSWTQEEDDLLIQKQEEFGNKWIIIARFFANRTDIQVKNRFNLLNRRIKKSKQKLQDMQNQAVETIVAPTTEFVLEKPIFNQDEANKILFELAGLRTNKDDDVIFNDNSNDNSFFL